MKGDTNERRELCVCKSTEAWNSMRHLENPMAKAKDSCKEVEISCRGRKETDHEGHGY